ncbi:MAG: hypothetical protein ACRETA_14495, partial [Gammaproteobacteria bacterium]
MAALATAISREASDATKRHPYVSKPTAARSILLLIVGHSGQIGSELCRQLEARQEYLRTQSLDLHIIGRLNTREFLWRDPGSQNVETFPR